MICVPSGSAVPSAGSQRKACAWRNCGGTCGGDLHRERHAVRRGGVHRLIDPRSDGPVGDLPQVRFFRPAGAFVTPLQGIFSVATMVCSWLTYQRPKAGPAGEPAERLAAALPVGPLSLPVA